MASKRIVAVGGIPYYVSGEVAHGSEPAHHTLADLEATGMRVRTDTLATAIDVAGNRLAVRDTDGRAEELPYDALIVGTGTVSVRPLHAEPGSGDGGERGVGAPRWLPLGTTAHRHGRVAGENALGGHRWCATAGHRPPAPAAPTTTRRTTRAPSVFVCTHNSARSHLAAAVWKGRSTVPTASAGTDPARGVHPALSPPHAGTASP
ncbi:hypothetical protein K4749_37950 [Streptomyces sp. TRM72054]|uniref:hypothetical protein n=1 Tax=Streptomyces sp. TRM72054 TaxID=2870562 RepID=UPI001C8B1771|nr:hypothetical protein [Streptomyces sp. TRM72054]MBX9399206.1 hypothetical protein [Streptomyces sp. TRM72054]